MVLDQQRLTKLKIYLNYSYFLIFIVIFSYTILTKHYDTNYNDETNEISGQIIEIDQYPNYSRLILKTKEKVIVNYYGNEILDYQLGDKVKATGYIYQPNQEVVFNLFNYRNYLKGQKIFWLFKTDKIELIEKNNSVFLNIKQKIINRIRNLNYSKEYVNNFILSKNKIDEQALTSYKINGTVHLLAISGAHIAFLVLILKKIKINDLIIIFILIFYLLLSNFSNSLMRAVLFFILLFINKKLKLKQTPLNILIYLAVFLLTINPYYIYDIGFIFSFTISFFLIRFKHLILNKKNYLSQSWMVSLIAYLASLPILIKNFFQINLLSPIINLIFVPVFTIIIYPLSIITFIIPTFDFLLSKIINTVETLSVYCSNLALLITIPAPNLFIFLLYYLIIYLILLNRFKIKFVLILILFIIIQKQIYFFNPNLIITAIDVGQGDSILIETPYRKEIVLIDTGGIFYGQDNYFIVQNRIIPYLKSRAITKLDLLVLTHGHYDHLG